MLTLTMEWMIEAGVAFSDAIHMATGAAAEMSRVAHRVGTIESGKLADIISVTGQE